MLTRKAQLTPDQKAHFEMLGYLVIPGFLTREEVERYAEVFMDVYRRAWGQEEFDPKFAVARPGASGVRHQIIPFFAKDERFLPLMDHPGLNDVVEELLGEDCLIMTAGEGFVAATDSIWHTDSRAPAGFASLKVAFYLDTVEAGAGCLNVIPGSHHDDYSAQIRRALTAGAWGGVKSPDVPVGRPLPSTPGDMIVFNHRTWHSSFGGKPGRRSIMVNYCQNLTEPWHTTWMTGMLSSMTSFWKERPFPDQLLEGADERRLRKMQKFRDMGF